MTRIDACFLALLSLLPACAFEPDDLADPAAEEAAGEPPPADERPRLLDHEPPPEEGFALEQAFPGRRGTPARGPVATNLGELELDYEVIDGVAVLEGDIVLGREEDLARARLHRSATRNLTSFRWPQGIIPYEIDSTVPAASKTMIQAAIDHWHTSTVFWFRPRSGETDYVRFTRGAGCSSAVGRQTGVQYVETAACSTGNLRHELGHTVGLWHEHTRSDRDSFIVVSWDNILDDKEKNYQTYLERNADGRDLYAMDFGSIMMYPAFVGSDQAIDTSRPVMTRLDGTTWTAQRNALSAGDIAGATRFLALDPGESTFLLRNLGAGTCLDNNSGAQQNGTTINQWACDGAANQGWYLHRIPWNDGKYIVVNHISGMCLDIPGASTQAGARLQQWSCHGYDHQQFAFLAQTGGYQLRARHSGQCLVVPGSNGASGTQVVQSVCDSGLNQRWRIE